MNRTSSSSNGTAQFSMRGLLIGVVIVAVIAACLGALKRWESNRKAEIARLAKQSERTKVEIVNQVEAICEQLGRAPRNQKELEKLLGEPMPVVYEDGIAEPIVYQRTGENQYQLWYESYWDDDWNYHSDWYYHSDAPKAGWVIVTSIELPVNPTGTAGGASIVVIAGH